MTATTEPPVVDAPLDDALFPCDSFKDAAPHLRRPFTSAAVKFKVQAAWPKDNPTAGLIVAYIDARLVFDRLNLLVPHLWHDAYRPVGQGQMWCDLTIDGITRSDVGEGVGKGLVSDALKRAAVHFGIGVSLYAIPKMNLTVDSGALKQKRTNKGLTLELLPRGEQILRDAYDHWLDVHGATAFGTPLDHGDAPDAQGDHEADAAPVPEGVDPATGEVTPAEAGPKLASPSDIRTIYQQANERLSACELLTLLLEAQDKPMQDVTEQEAIDRLDAVIHALPADKVPTVLAKIA